MAAASAKDASHKEEHTHKEEEKKDNDWFASAIGTMEKYEEMKNNPQINPCGLLETEIILEIFNQLKENKIMNDNSLKNLTIWDYGAGTGRNTKIFLNLISHKDKLISKVIASDLSKSALLYLNNKLSKFVESNELTIIENTESDINNKDNIKIDFLFLGSVLHHLEGENRPKILKNIKDNLILNGNNGKLMVFEFSKERSEKIFAAMANARAKAAAKAKENEKDKEKQSKNSEKDEWNNSKKEEKHGKDHHGHHHGHGHDHDHDHGHGHGHGHGGKDGASEIAHKHNHDFKTMKETIEDLEKNHGFKAICSVDFGHVFKKNESWQKVLKPHNIDSLDGYYAVVFEPK